MELLDIKVEALESVDAVEAEYVVEVQEAFIAPVILIFLSAWTVQRLMLYMKCGAS